MPIYLAYLLGLFILIFFSANISAQVDKFNIYQTHHFGRWTPTIFDIGLVSR